MRFAWLRENRYLLTGWFWIVATVPTLLWLKDSVLWVALMSLYANAATGFAANEARRARKNAEPVEPPER